MTGPFLLKVMQYQKLKKEAEIEYQAFLKREAEKKAALKLKQKEKRPMTRLVNEAVIEYLEKKEKDNDKEKQRYF